MQLTLQEQEEFKQEAFELIEGIESAFLSLEGGTSLTDLYDELFRGLHNLKGASSMMEMVSLKELIHQMETSFTAYKNQPSIDDEVLTQLIKGIDQCKRLLRGESVATGENFLSLEELLKEWQSNGENPESNARVLAVFHQLKTTYSENKSTSVIIEVTLQIIASRNVACKTKIIIAKKAHELIEKIDELIKCGASPEECLPIALKFKETVGQKIEEREVFVAPKVQQVSNRPVVEAQVKSNELSSVRVNLDLLDNLLNLMGELVLVRNQVLQFSESFQNSQLGVITKKLNLVTSEIQEQMMKTRMQPIGVVLGKMNRIVRDISKSLGKKIDLKLEGDETEVDRTILDAIKDPLTHIVRNACDHGLETTEERLAQGKSEVGLLKISTYQEGGQVIVDITDDGRGINKDKILKKALQNNVIREEDASKLSDRDIYNLIFSPGFSTAVAEHMGKGSTLYLGAGESLVGLKSCFEPLKLANATIYRKR